MRFTPFIDFKLINSSAVLPKRATDGSAAYDIFLPADSPEYCILNPGEQRAFPLGFAVWIKSPEWCMVMMPRSGAGKRGLHLANVLGLVDSDYQGEVQLILKNVGETDQLVIDPTYAVAQAVFLPVGTPYFTLVNEFETETARGAGGFGSTDIPTREVISQSAFYKQSPFLGAPYSSVISYDHSSSHDYSSHSYSDSSAGDTCGGGGGD